MIHPKVIGGSLAGAVGVILTAVLIALGADVSGSVGSAISTVAAAIGGYLTPAQ